MRNDLLQFCKEPAFVAGVAVAVALIGLAGATARAGTTFQVLDNTAYSDVTIGDSAIKTNFIPARYCQPLTWNSTTGKVQLPSQSDWDNLVNTYDPTPANSTGFLVLDCEKLYLIDSSATIANRFAILKQLQEWTQAIRPNRVLGWYGLVNTFNISTQDPADAYQDIAALMDLHPGYTAYFPSAYITSSDTSPYTGAAWTTQLNTDIATAAAIDTRSSSGSHPVYPYIWPQNYDNVTTLVPAAQWQVMLNTILSTSATGLVIWGGQNPAVEYNASNGGYGPWVGITQTFLSTL
ncbi:hypothetical protein [Paraburkholderia bannensis]|uniref:hypothetical protein n=1 Tax=Paraburkholderia bannensis TaxID=765414 RepID=UPI002ABE075D|nr:hypothetical protein [Paraburkholderia bannensis]